jgi:hypothetical protein
MIGYGIPEDVLKQAFLNYQSRRLEALTEMEEKSEPYDFSSTFILKMEKLIHMQKKSYYLLINTISKRAAIIVLIILVTLFSTVFSVKALRDPTVNFIVHVYETISTIIFGTEDNQNDTYPGVIEEYYEPVFVPDGFEIEEKRNVPLLYQIEYYDKNDGDLLYEQFSIKSAHFSIDTEGVSYENIKINGFSGIYYSNKGYQNYIWSDGRYGYCISGNIPREILLKMTESLEKVEK